MAGSETTGASGEKLAPWPFYPFGPLTGTVPAVPQEYWNVYSDEQRWKWLYANFKSLGDYVNSAMQTIAGYLEESGTGVLTRTEEGATPVWQEVGNAQLADGAVTPDKVDGLDASASTVTTLKGLKLIEPTVDSEGNQHFRPVAIGELDAGTAIATQSITADKLKGVEGTGLVRATDDGFTAGTPVATEEIADNAIETSKVADTQITFAKLAGNGVITNARQVEMQTPQVWATNKNTDPTKGDITPGTPAYSCVNPSTLLTQETVSDVSNWRLADWVSTDVWSINSSTGVVTYNGGGDNYQTAAARVLCDTPYGTVGQMVSVGGNSKNVYQLDFDIPETLTLKVGESYQFVPTGVSHSYSKLDDLLYPPSDLSVWLTYHYTNPQPPESTSTSLSTGDGAVATVSYDGLVTAMRPGVVKVNATTATPNSGSGNHECTITVIDESSDRELGTASSRNLSDLTFIVKDGDELALAQNVTADSVEIADGSVTTAKLADGSVTLAKIADESVGASQLRSNSVSTAHLTDSCVTGAKIADDTITGSKLRDGTITGSNVHAQTLTFAKFSPFEVQAGYATIGDSLAAGAHATVAVTLPTPMNFVADTGVATVLTSYYCTADTTINVRVDTRPNASNPTTLSFTVYNTGAQDATDVVVSWLCVTDLRD